MRQLVGFLVIGAAVGVLWLSGFYSHHGSVQAPSPVTTSQPEPAGTAKPKIPHVPRVPHVRSYWLRTLTGNGNSNGGNGQ